MGFKYAEYIHCILVENRGNLVNTIKALLIFSVSAGPVYLFWILMLGFQIIIAKVLEQKASNDMKMKEVVKLSKKPSVVAKVNKPCLLVAIKEDFERIQPFPGLPSNLVTLIILQYIEKDEAINLL